MFSDLRYALRHLAKSPGFTGVAVLSLALGIGVTTTVLCWIGHVLRRPLPGVVRQEQIAALVSNQGGGNVSLLDLRDLAALDRVFAGGVATQITPASLLIDRAPLWIYGQIATTNFFDLPGVRPILGRTFLPEEDRQPGGNPVLVLRETLWRRVFGADPKVIGRTVDLNRHPFTIIGVVPAEFTGTMTDVRCEFRTPMSMVSETASWGAAFLTSRQSRGSHNAVRLLPGGSLAQAQAAVDALDRHLAVTLPKTNREVHHRVVAYADCPYGAQSVLGAPLKLLLPAWQATRTRLYEGLKEGGRASATGGAAQHHIRRGLVVAEIALALVLLISAGLCLQGLRRARQSDFGFAPDLPRSLRFTP